MRTHYKSVARKHSSQRTLRLECFESRELMAVDFSMMHDASSIACDNSDQFVSKLNPTSHMRAPHIGWSFGTWEIGPQFPRGAANSQSQPHSLDLQSTFHTLSKSSLRSTEFESLLSFATQTHPPSAILELPPINSSRSSTVLVVSVVDIHTPRQTLIVISGVGSPSLSTPLSASPSKLSQVFSATAVKNLPRAPVAESDAVTFAESVSQRSPASIELATVGDIARPISPMMTAAESATNSDTHSNAQPAFAQSRAGLLQVAASSDLEDHLAEVSAVASIVTRIPREYSAELEGMIELLTFGRESPSALARNPSSKVAGSYQFLNSLQDRREKMLNSVDLVFQEFDTDLPIPDGMIWIALPAVDQPSTTNSGSLRESLTATINPFAAFQIFLPGLSNKLPTSTDSETDSIAADDSLPEQSAETTGSSALDNLLITVVAAAWIYLAIQPNQEGTIAQTRRNLGGQAYGPE